MAEIRNYTSEDMKFENLSKNHLTLVDFWAAWCGPCRDGCPSCVGATAGPGAKDTLLAILDELLGE